MSKLSHFNKDGAAHMVDVADKKATRRVAVASGRITMQPETLEKIQSGEHKKGDVLGIARIAGIMASKQTSVLVPLCHQVVLTHVDVGFEVDAAAQYVECKVRAETVDRTGIEIEALCAVQVALLTIYDMCKSVDRGMRIESVQLLYKAGGKSGEFGSY